MPIAEISVVPIGTESTGVSSYVRAALKIVEENDLEYEVGPMGTSVEGELDAIFAVVRAIHEELAKMGCNRVLTTIRIDDRRDKFQTMAGKKAAVLDEV
jgi:uncharacterized protein (TIGR00106 family)